MMLADPWAEARRLYEVEGFGKYRIARMTGLNHTAVLTRLHREGWKKADRLPAIRAEYESGVKIIAIAKQFGRSEAVIKYHARVRGWTRPVRNGHAPQAAP